MALLLNLRKRNEGIFPNHRATSRVFPFSELKKKKKFSLFQIHIIIFYIFYLHEKKMKHVLYTLTSYSIGKYGGKKFHYSKLLVLYLNHNCHFVWCYLVMEPRKSSQQKGIWPGLVANQADRGRGLEEWDKDALAERVPYAKVSCGWAFSQNQVACNVSWWYWRRNSLCVYSPLVFTN